MDKDLTDAKPGDFLTGTHPFYEPPKLILYAKKSLIGQEIHYKGEIGEFTGEIIGYCSGEIFEIYQSKLDSEDSKRALEYILSNMEKEDLIIGENLSCLEGLHLVASSKKGGILVSSCLRDARRIP